jgi:dephospho-CoA kinase
MPRIALTGGIACGKSLVARYLNEMGVETIDADDVVHGLIPNPEERRRIAAEVFDDPEKRRALEARIHPQVKARIDEFLAPRANSNNQTIRIAVIPLLFETHWDAEYDIICCVRSSRAAQVARMAGTRGYSRKEAEARLAAQLPVEEKAEKSHYVIDNDGTTAELKTRVAEFVKWLKERQDNVRRV